MFDDVTKSKIYLQLKWAYLVIATEAAKIRKLLIVWSTRLLDYTRKYRVNWIEIRTVRGVRVIKLSTGFSGRQRHEQALTQTGLEEVFCD